jgi:hypothetical protein
MKTLKIPVTEMEVDAARGVIYVHGPTGWTVLRLKTKGEIHLVKTADAPSSSTDFVVEDDIYIRVGTDSQPGNLPEEFDRAKRKKPTRKKMRNKPAKPSKV